MAACGIGVGVAQLLLAQPLGLLVTVAAVGSSAAYSSPRIGLERRRLLGTLLLAGRPVAPAVLAAVVTGGTATLLYKDVKDEAGDRLLGKRTPLVRWGMRRMEAVAALLGAAAVVLGLLAVGPGWWTAALVGGVATQVAMAACSRSTDCSSSAWSAWPRRRADQALMRTRTTTPSSWASCDRTPGPPGLRTFDPSGR